MDVMFTAHPSDDDTDHFMAVASREEWLLLLLDLKYALKYPNPVTKDLVSQLKSWGIGE